MGTGSRGHLREGTHTFAIQLRFPSLSLNSPQKGLRPSWDVDVGDQFPQEHLKGTVGSPLADDVKLSAVKCAFGDLLLPTRMCPSETPTCCTMVRWCCPKHFSDDTFIFTIFTMVQSYCPTFSYLCVKYNDIYLTLS